MQGNLVLRVTAVAFSPMQPGLKTRIRADLASMKANQEHGIPPGFGGQPTRNQDPEMDTSDPGPGSVLNCGTIM